MHVFFVNLYSVEATNFQMSETQACLPLHVFHMVWHMLKALLMEAYMQQFINDSMNLSNTPTFYKMATLNSKMAPRLQAWILVFPHPLV